MKRKDRHMIIVGVEDEGAGQLWHGGKNQLRITASVVRGRTAQRTTASMLVH